MKDDCGGNIPKDVELEFCVKIRSGKSQIVHEVLELCEVLKGRPSKNVLWQ